MFCPALAVLGGCGVWGGGGETRFVLFYDGLRCWEAHFYVFFVSGRLRRARMSNLDVGAGWSAKERPSRAWGEREGGETRSVMFYEGLRLWEGRGRFDGCIEDCGSWRLNLLCFTCPGGPRGIVLLTKLWPQVGPLKKDPHVRVCGGGGEWGRRVGGGARFDECIEDSGSGGLDLPCYTRV